VETVREEKMPESEKNIFTSYAFISCLNSENVL